MRCFVGIGISAYITDSTERADMASSVKMAKLSDQPSVAATGNRPRLQLEV